VSWLPLPLHRWDQVKSYEQRQYERKRDGVNIERDGAPGRRTVCFWHDRSPKLYL
jgi:hypothetical protein